MAGGGLLGSAKQCQPEVLRCAKGVKPMSCMNGRFPLRMFPCVRA